MLRPSSPLVRSRVKYGMLLTLAVASTMAVAASCATAAQPTVFPGSDGGGTPGSETGVGGDGGIVFPETSISFPGADTGPGGGDGGCGDGGCSDFPAAPLVDTTAPLPAGVNPGTLFGAAGTGTTTGGPCLAEPADGALYPYNWLRPRILWEADATQNAFEVRISAPGELNDYVVYTTAHFWTLDEPTWQAIAGIEAAAASPGTLVGVPITITVRATNSSTPGTPTISNSATIQIAPAIADGALIFWSTSSFANTSTSTNLQGFHVGDEGTTPALTVPQVLQQVWAGPPDGGDFPSPPTLEPVGCIGCHTATPDGLYVGFTAQWPWPNAIASVQTGTVGAAPPWLTPGAIANLGPNTGDVNYLGGGYVTPTNNVDNVMLGIQTFSPKHYGPQAGAYTEYIEVASVGASLDAPDNQGGMLQPTQPACVGGTSPCVTSQLAWINLAWDGSGDAGSRPSAAPGALSNGGWGILSRGTDTNSAGTPNWSNDGTTIAYTSVVQGTKDGRLDQPMAGTSADIKTIPYGGTAGTPGGTGGNATPLPGASSTALNEYFPAFSPDDSLIAFNSIPAVDTMYDQPLAELYVVPYVAGGTTVPAVTCDGAGAPPCRLKANDPVACTQLKSPGVQNTWPKWAPNPIPPGAGDAGVPAPQTIGGFTYYWVTFSSIRSTTAGAAPGALPGTAKQQLYVAGIVVDRSGNIRTYAPIYLWNQDDTFNNLIPAWGEFQIPVGKTPPPPPPIVMPPH